MNINQALQHVLSNKSDFDVNEFINPMIGFSFTKKDGFMFADLRYSKARERFILYVKGGHSFTESTIDLTYHAKLAHRLIDELPVRLRGIDYNVRETNLEFQDGYDYKLTTEHNLYHFFPSLPDPYKEGMSHESFNLKAKQLITDLNQFTYNEYQQEIAQSFDRIA